MKMKNLNPDHVKWFKNVFNSTQDGGIFIIPRAGLQFKKIGDSMVLVKMIPYKPEQCDAKSAEAWAEAQMYEFNMASLHFSAAGVRVSMDLN